MESVSVKINQETLLKNLRFSFSTPFTVLKELLQNGRRAGATSIKITYDRNVLTVEDNGCGVADFQKILTVADSGWSADVVANDKPYGMGFLSAIYAGNHVKVSSRGRMIEFDSSAALLMDSIVVRQTDDYVEGTRVTLEGIELRDAEVQVPRLVEAFPIAIVFNGRVLPRPYAENADYLDVGVGVVSASTLPGNGRKIGTTAIAFYLQGFRIKVDGHYYYDYSEHHVVHLDSKKFIARMPDREQLVGDQSELVATVAKRMKQHVRKMVETDKKLLSAFDFVKKWQATRTEWDYIELFDDVPVLPAGVLKLIDDYPHTERGYDRGQGLSHETRLIPREDFGTREVWAVQLRDRDEIPSGAAPAWVLAYMTGALVLVNGDCRGISRDHWLYSELEDWTDEEEFKVEVDNASETFSVYLEGPGRVDYQLCDSWKITRGAISSGAVSDCCLMADDVLLIPPQAHPSVDQVFNYADECEEHREDEMREDDADKFFTAVNFQRRACKSPTEAAILVVEQLMEKLPRHERALVKGMSFEITFNDGLRHGDAEPTVKLREAA